MEDDVIIGGQAGVADHLTIGQGARLLVQSGTIADIPAGATVSGYPARSHREYLRAQAALYRLAKIVDELEQVVRPAPESAPADSPSSSSPLSPPSPSLGAAPDR